MDSVLGWKLQNPAKKSINIVLRQGGQFSVVEAKNLEKYYLLEYFPQLSGQEELLLKNVFEAFLCSKKEEKSEKGIMQTLQNYCENNLIELDENQKKYFAKIFELMVFEFGPISCFLKDPLIEEVSVIGIGGQKPVYVYEKNFGWLKTNLFFLDEQAVKNLANRMGRTVGRHLSLQNPNLNAFLPDGSRLNACIDPIALEPALTIRKFKEQPFTPVELVENNTISARAVAFLWLALQTDCSVLVCGNTGSGKTTTLNALFCLIPRDERIVVAEETPEINLVQEHIVNLKTAENIGVKMSDLIVNTFRMRPDRIIVGEMRDSEEVNAFVNTLLAGQAKGSYATFHAKSAHEAILRLKKLGVLEADISSIDLVVVQKRWNKIDAAKNLKKEIRRVTEIAELENDNGSVSLNFLFEYDWKKDFLIEKNRSKKVLEKICRTFGLSEKGVDALLKKREKEIMGFFGKNLSVKDFFGLINNAVA